MSAIDGGGVQQLLALLQKMRCSCDMIESQSDRSGDSRWGKSTRTVMRFICCASFTLSLSLSRSRTLLSILFTKSRLAVASPARDGPILPEVRQACPTLAISAGGSCPQVRFVRRNLFERVSVSMGS